MLDILDKYKVNPQILEHLQRQANYVAINNIFDSKKLEGKRRSMNKDKGLCVQQHRREYYNDFEDCLRDYKNAKIKSIQKQTKVHLSDGDNGESDSDYVDCTDSAELKHQSTHKSMPHVPTGNYQDNSSSSSFCQQLNQKAVTTKRNESEAQLNTNYAVPPAAKNETSAQLTSPHKNNHNRIIDTSCNRKGSRSVAAKVSSGEKSISIDDDNVITTTRIPSTSNNDNDDIKHHVNQNAADKQSKSNEAIRPTPVQTKRDEQTKRRSCKKKLLPLPEVVAVAVKDPTQR